MPIATPPAKLGWLQPQQFVAAAMPGPLATLLDDTNHFYWRHRPAWLSHGVSADLSSTSRDYVIPCPTPSADGLRYDLRLVLMAGAAGTCTIRVYETATLDPTTATWSQIAATVGFALVNGYAVETYSPAVSATTVAIKVAVTSITTACKVAHVYACPSPNSGGAPFLSGGVTASGFRVYDGSLLGTAGRPVTQELVDRCHRNTATVVQDRKQVLATLLTPWIRTGNTLKAPQTWTASGGWVTVGRVRAQIPQPGAHTVSVAIHGSRLGGGATADLVQISTISGYGENAVATFDADDTIQTAPIGIETDADGWVEFRVAIRAGAGQTTYCHAVTIWWEPGQDLDPAMRLTGTGPQTVASASLLSAAWELIRSRAMSAHCAVGHMIDASTTGRTVTLGHVSVPRGVDTMRLVAYRCSDNGPGAAPATLLAGTTDGSIATPADSCRYYSGATGTNLYWGCQADGAAKLTQLLIGGATYDASPTGSGLTDRALNVTANLVGSVELVRIENAASWTIYTGQLNADPSSL